MCEEGCFMKKIAILLGIPAIILYSYIRGKQRIKMFEELSEEWFRRSEAAMGINRES